MASEQKKCFVIMPFSETTKKHAEEYWTRHYNEFLKPLIESTKLLKADRSSALRGDILRQIITDLVTAPIVVAELTDCNPNVFWELGVRQSFRHCTITIAEEGFELPFDLGVKGTLFYPTGGNHIKNQKFHQQFLKAIDDCLNSPESPDSHVLETITGRGTLYQVITKQESLRKLNAVIIENESNIELLRDCKKDCENNASLREAKQEGKIAMTTARYSLRCLENLLVNRYLESEESFYALGLRCARKMEAHNGMLAKWSDSAKRVEKWILRTEKDLEELLEKWQKELATKKAELELLI